MIGFITLLIGLIVRAIQRRPIKWYLAGLPICFALFVTGVSLLPDNVDNQTTIKATTQSAPTDSVQSQVSSKSITDDAIEVDYKTLYKDYDDNPINADKKYRDKKLILTGSIAKIDRDIGQHPYITFNVDEYGLKSIKMSFNDDDTVAALKKGQEVTVVGTCSGTFASTIIVLNDCSIVQ
jgi:hypothetical protein